MASDHWDLALPMRYSEFRIPRASFVSYGGGEPKTKIKSCENKATETLELGWGEGRKQSTAGLGNIKSWAATWFQESINFLGCCGFIDKFSASEVI